MSQPGAARQALTHLIDAGMAGTYHALAQAAGLPAHQVRVALKEMSRCGQARACSGDVAAPRAGRGRPPQIYAAAPAVVDAIAFAREHWR